MLARMHGIALRLMTTVFVITGGAAPAAAASINIVVLGASNTYGKGVARGAALPAQLQAMLRAKGYDVHVDNAGINGDTTAGMLRRLNAAVSAGIQLVSLQPGNNEVRKGVDGDPLQYRSHYRKPAGARRQGVARGAYARRVAATLAAGRRTSHGGRISSRRRAHASTSRGGYRRTLKLLSCSRRSS